MRGYIGEAGDPPPCRARRAASDPFQTSDEQLVPKTMPKVPMRGFLLAASAVLLLSAGGHADAKTLRTKLKPYCTSDYLRLCDPSDTSRASIVSCFKRNVSSVSLRCRKAIARNTEFEPDRIERRRN